VASTLTSLAAGASLIWVVQEGNNDGKVEV
jgi:hypothetical protein